MSIRSLDDIKDGSTIAIPNDPTNAARAFNTLQDAGLVTVSEDADSINCIQKDIVENPKNLEFQEIEAGQLPRAVESADLIGSTRKLCNCSKMNLLDALQLENMDDRYRNVVAVKTENKDSQLAKDIIEVVESDRI